MRRTTAYASATCLAAAFFLGCATRPAEGEAVDVGLSDERRENGPRTLLEHGELQVDVMTVAFPPRYRALMARMQTALRANPVWVREHAKKAKPGEPLPYDERLGLTRTEYEELQSLAGESSLEKVREATIRISPGADDDVFVLDGGLALPHLSGVEIDLGRDQVRTPFGVLNTKAESEISESLIGAWKGVSWRLEEVDERTMTGKTVRLNLGTKSESGKAILVYDLRVIRTDGKIRAMYILQYDQNRNSTP